MTTLFNSTPDKIEQSTAGAYLFYFADGKDIRTLPSGAEYTVVSSPAGYTGQWYVRSFKIVRHITRETTIAQVLNARLLEPCEIPFFQGLIGQN